MLTLYKSFTVSQTPPPPKSPGTSPDPESGQAILDHRFSRRSIGSISTLEKRSTVPFRTANYRNSLDQFQLGERPLEKRGVGIFFSRQESEKPGFFPMFKLDSVG